MRTYGLITWLVAILAGLIIPLQDTPAASQGHMVYVSTAGNNATGNGSIDKPFRTIGHALTQAVAGDEIVLRGAPAVADNRYKENVRIELPNITLRSQTGEWAVIECPTNDENITECVRLDVDSSGSKVKNLEIIGGYYYGIMLYTRWDWGDPRDRSGASNILIERTIVHNTGRDAIKITPGCDDVTIRRVEIYNTGVRDNSNAEGIDNVNGDRTIVQDSYLHDIATNGIYLKGGAVGGIIERNRIERVGEAGILVGFDTSPEYFDLTVNPHYYENINGIVRNNTIIDTQYAGIGLYAAQNAQIINNTLINTAQTAHSPIYFGVTYQDWDATAERPASVNPIIKNNLISQPAGGSDECVFIRYADDLGGLSGLSGMPVMDYNLFYHAGGACLFTDRRPRSYLDMGSFSQWKAHIRGDTHSLTTDPQLTADGALPADSPAVNAGANAGCPARDQRGVPRPQGTACDMGALEVASTAVFKSIGASDGWVLESAENSEEGGALDADGATINLGDDAARNQYRAILHFDTEALPDNAVITDATLKVMTSAGKSGNPSTLGALLVDITKPAFDSDALTAGDFQVASGKSNIFKPFTASGKWRNAAMKNTGFVYVNRRGSTQLRLYFSKGDNDDNIADILPFYSGNATNVALRPQLIIQYYVP